jgi:site-specific DNA-cytosine methylase
MKVLIACEFSGIVRNEFSKLGHNAWSADLLPSEIPGQHIEGDMFTDLGEWKLGQDWDLMIAHPPCTYLSVSGARWWETKQVEQRKAMWFFMSLVELDIPRIAVENPIGFMSTHYRKPDQIIQPWQFGHGETKATCLWLKNLPKLIPTNIVPGREQRIHKMTPSPDRGKERSRTYLGIAQAMANQWDGIKLR